MKKLLSLLGVMAILLTMLVSVFAGDIVTPLMTQDNAQVYFGEVKALTDSTVTIIQKKNVKGEFKQDVEYEYERKDFTTRKELETGKVYLCAVSETRDNLMLWEVTSTDTKTLKVLGDDAFAGVMQQYINEGMFEKAESERLAKIEQSTQPDTSSTSVIGGADEPTNIVVKSNVNIWLVVGLGALVLLLVIVIIVRKKKR